MLDILNDVYDRSIAPSENLSRFNSISSILGAAINFVLAVAFGLSIVTLAYNIVQLIMSMGDVKAVKKATDGIGWSILGLFLTMAAFAIKNVLVNSIGITTPEITGDLPGSF